MVAAEEVRVSLAGDSDYEFKISDSRFKRYEY